ncbi:NUDIX hydrolase [Gaetbulibacter aestuarii]|uniref:NUDIX domain-containing protein n=1 Tax=Gaetbulibacter aestuarii TaxID=1502358 RepID=A0ABW7MYS4_9FLAO
MYHIFVNDKPIILTTKDKKPKGAKSYKLKTVIMRRVIKKLNKSDIEAIYLTHHNEDKILKKFLKKLPNVIAGGGKVHNQHGEVLFIYRNDRWDLPKGKAEGKESIEDTAIREVEEETGVKNLTITKPLETTYHILKRNNRYKIKITYWFEMNTDYDGKLEPQTKEGITKAKWLNKKKMKKALKNSYANIKRLV